MTEELLEVVNERGEVIGTASRQQIHGNNRLLHRVVHLLVFDTRGRLLLQKRSERKDVAPGRWDTSVGGHVGLGEDIEEALRREAEEELGIHLSGFRFLYSYIHTNSYESELVYTFCCTHNGPFRFNPEEITEVRFWDLEELLSLIGKGVLSDNFEEELQRYLEYKEQKGGADAC